MIEVEEGSGIRIRVIVVVGMVAGISIIAGVVYVIYRRMKMKVKRTPYTYNQADLMCY